MLGAGLSLDLKSQTVSLGTAENFAVLGATTVTNTGASVLNGDLGVSPGTALTGFFAVDGGPGVVNGSIYSAGAEALQAQEDAEDAFDAIAAMAFTTDLTGQNLGGLTLTPGVYHFDTSAQLTGNLTLDGVGEYIFQIGSTLTTASNASITGINGADASQFFFNVGSSATLGTGTQFAGTILALTSITLTTGADIDYGRAIALNGAVTMDTNFINAVPEPSSALLVGGALIYFGMFRSRHSMGS
ncbi:DUF3494 domain-containing protein [Phragmitibacter flavus]|uniref:DUF3494 domain-containing protein n=2 Tax=Phragmitibacter flavus TaxID=2576071 RepID=A0A5R8K9S6_9BACT|nr:DUF3494 domain-containing protein [Phragmitibacter flavus]